MDDAKLSKLHDDFKKGSETRGKHGGLGKSSASSGKRIQIEYVEKSSQQTSTNDVPAGPNPKQPFIRFVPASRPGPPVMKQTSDEDEKPAKPNGTELSSDDEVPKKKSKTEKSSDRSAKRAKVAEVEEEPTGKDVRHTTIRSVKPGEDFLSNAQGFVDELGSHLVKVNILNGWAEKPIKKVKVRTSTGDVETIKNAQFVSLTGSIDLETEKTNLTVHVIQGDASRAQEVSGELVEIKSKTPIHYLMSFDSYYFK